MVLKICRFCDYKDISFVHGSCKTTDLSWYKINRRISWLYKRTLRYVHVCIYVYIHRSMIWQNRYVKHYTTVSCISFWPKSDNLYIFWIYSFEMIIYLLCYIPLCTWRHTVAPQHALYLSRFFAVYYSLWLYFSGYTLSELSITSQPYRSHDIEWRLTAFNDFNVEFCQ